ncbi:class I SAM-dependent methyltransferase [Hyphococcus sp.]|uniref:class I SAM-dependent methyltransferase n=1 Tax=Hyphococcus sp. TaxID=2038636 RepID=UPI003CCB81D9
MVDKITRNDAESWSAYWAGAEAANQSLSGGVRGEALDRFWASFFTNRLKDGPRTMIELACGAAPVSANALKITKASGFALTIHCTDYSPAAVRGVSVIANISGFVADACTLPLPSEVYDFAVTQFGLEYAGFAAFDEVARILRPEGVFAAVIHLKGGGIEDECAANLNIILKTQKIGLLPRAREVFKTGFAVLAGRAPREKLLEADKAFAPTVQAAKSLIAESPASSARAFLLRLYSDLGHMYRRIGAYAPDDIEAWIGSGEFELKAYEHRMSSMISAAQSEDDMKALIDRLRAAGLNVTAPEILHLGVPLKPAAWALIAEKPA